MSETSELTVRRFEPKDAVGVWELHNQALASTGAYVGNGPWDEDMLDPKANYLDRGGEFLLGFMGDELVAMGAYVPIDADAVEIRRMRVSPSMQRQGFGRRILVELEARARNLGYATARLDTTREQVAAQELYRVAGYRVIGNGRAGPFETILFERALT